MTQLLALARDLDRIELLDVATGNRQVIITETGRHPDGVVCDGTTIFWTTMGERTSVSPGGEAVYADVDGGVHAIDVNGLNRRDIVAPGGTTTGKQLALDGRGNLYWGNREGFSLATARTDGTGLRDLIRRDGAGEERDWIVGLSLDEVKGHIYWSQKGSFAGGDGKIFRAGLEIPAGRLRRTAATSNCCGMACQPRSTLSLSTTACSGPTAAPARIPAATPSTGRWCPLPERRARPRRFWRRVSRRRSA